jgi:hypothetical protein
MTGRRNDVEPHLYEPGDYGRWKDQWYALTPTKPNLLANVTGHKVTEHEDRTITVSPSILVESGGGLVWHGFLERGVWRQC